VIPNIANPDKFKREAKKDILGRHEEVFENHFNYITVGSLTEQKAQWYLIRCFYKLSQNEENTKLIILGEGPLKEELERLAKDMGLEDRVIFLGEVENVFPYLRKADCFVFTSLFEGFPNVLVEALSQDLPIISTDCISGPREILCPELKVGEEVSYPYLGEYGMMTEPLDEKRCFKTLEEKPLSEEENKLFKLMVKVKEDEELRDRYSNVSRRVEDFEPGKIVPRWISLIEES
ncbi:MAG: glycosyltransferase, partial [Candidatus Natronoplasma sp.]